MSDLEKLEEILERKIEAESNRGVRLVARLGKFNVFVQKIKWLLLDILVYVEGPENKHRVMGILFGWSLILSILVYTYHSLFGLVLVAFMIIYVFLSYPEALSLFRVYVGYVILGIARRGSIVTITTPKEIARNLKSVEFILLIFVWGLPLFLVSSSIITVIYAVLSSVIVGLTSIAYYYLSMALVCWNDPFKKITERDLFSWRFIIFMVLFSVSIADIYLLVRIGFGSLFGWFTVFLTYLFLSAIIAIPSFQAAIYVTVKWRKSGIQSIISEIMSKIG